MPTRVYVGPCAAIETVLDGVKFDVARGETVDVSLEQAKALDAQPDNWAEPKANGSKEGRKPKGGDD